MLCPVWFNGMVACHLVLMMMAAVWDRSDIVRQPPSAAFIEHDVDQDDWISREEWESRYGTSAMNRTVVDFERGDCDRDGRLDWQEFYLVGAGRFHCHPVQRNLLPSPASTAPQAADSATVVVGARDVELARVSLARSRQRLVVAKFHEHYSEQDWPTGVLYDYSLACGEAEPVEIPALSRDFRHLSRLATVGRGAHSAVRCSFANRSRYTITFVQLRLSLGFAGVSVVADHGKTLWVPPEEAREFWIFTAAGAPVNGVSVLGVRKLRD